MKRYRLSRIAFFILFALLLISVFINREAIDLSFLKRFVETSGIFGPIIFIFSYALTTILFFPGSAITFLGGVLFGPILGTLYNLTGATLGATFAFLISRYLLSDFVASKSSGKVKQITKAVDAEGWRFVAFVRLIPLFPFNLVNYIFGITKVKLSHYFFATFLFMLPGGFVYTYLGYAGSEALQGEGGWIKNVTIALSLVLAAAFLPRLVKRFKNLSIKF